MPWRGPGRKGEFPTLGYAVADWIEAHCAIPDGEHAGQPFLLTDEQLRFLLFHYRLREDIEKGGKPSAAFRYRRSQLVRPQKWGKGPLSAAWVCAEAAGPVVFDGWDAAGEPVGRPWATPWIQCVATSEDQVANVWTALLPMIELGSLAADIPDTGKTRINVRGEGGSSGLIEPVTSAAISRLGQRITAAVHDEAHSWTRHNGGVRLADTQRRNLAGMGGRAIETTNAWDPAEGSVAQQTFESKAQDIYRDFPDPLPGSVRNKRERRKVLRHAYRGAPWVDLDRIDAEIEELLDRDPAQAERFYLNRVVATQAAALDPAVVGDRARAGWEPDPGDLIVVGVDGARFADAVAVVATHVESGHQWPLGIWERPESAGDDYEHPAEAIDGAVTDAFDRWRVWRLYADPQWIEHLIDRWAGRWGKDRVVAWFTNRPRQAAWAVRNFEAAVAAGDWSHNADPVFVSHLRNACREKVGVYDDDHRQMHTLSKDRPGSPRKIDAAMAAVISWEARGDAIAAGATVPPRSRQAVFL